MEKSYEELQEELDDLMGKIDEAMMQSRQQQKDLDEMEEAMMEESKPMKLEVRKKEFAEKGQYKTEFDEMTKNALVNAQKNIIVLRQHIEKAYQDMLEETLRKQNSIKEKEKIFAKKDLTPEKRKMVEETTQKLREDTNTKMFEFQKKHFEQRAILDKYQSSINKYASELGAEKELGEIKPEQVIKEFNEAKNKAETPGPGTPVPGTPAPGTPGPGTPVPGTPAPGTPVPGTPVPGTPVPGTPAPGTPAPGTPTPGTPTPGNSGSNGIEEIVLENNAEEFSRNCSLEEFKKEIFEDVDFVKAIFETAPQEKKDAIIKGMYEHPKMDRRLLYRITHDKNATPEKFKAYTDIVATEGELKRFSDKEIEKMRKQLPKVVYDLKKRNHVKFSERYDNYQDALKTQELFEKMGFEDKVEVNVGWFDKALFGLKTKWDRFIENRDKNLLLSDGSEKENTEPENTETSSLRDEIKVKANPEPQKSEPAPVEAKEQENEER